VAQVLKLRTWLDGRQKPQVFKPEAQAKELAGIALESSFAYASGFDYWGGVVVSPVEHENVQRHNLLGGLVFVHVSRLSNPGLFSVHL
jgi:hypothetical protein